METFEIDGKEYGVVKPNGRQIRESKKIFNKVFANAVRDGAFLRANIRKLAEEHGIWNKEQENKLAAIRAEIDKYVKILDNGGIELGEARKYAIKINELRTQVLDLINILNDLDQMTAEGQAMDESRNYLISQCIVYKDTKKPYCISVDDFYAKEDDPVVITGVVKYVSAENKESIEILQSLPEIKFLKEFKFMDDNYNYINESGEVVDSDGNPISVQEEKVERKPFLKDGKPVA